VKFQFNTGNQIINRYVATRWLSGGRKLKTDYYTYVVPLAIPLDSGKVITNPKYIVNVVNLSGTSYVDDAEYTRRSDGLTYANGGKVYNSEGYTNGDGLTAYSYYRKDHLGNNREVWCPNTTAQRTEYYPSGLPWSEGLNPSTQEHKYNGKEFIEMDRYDTYDYGARGYYPAMWRFTSVDPLAEMYYSISPYVYCKNNPVNYIDPNGEFSLLGAVWFWLFHGGGDIGKDKATDEFFVGQKVESKTATGIVKRNFDKNGRNHGVIQYGQMNGASINGTANHQMLDLPNSKYHEPSIDMKKASTDAEAFDLWAKIFNNNESNADSDPIKNNEPKVVSDEVIDYGVVEDVQDDGSVTQEAVSIRTKDGTIYHFNYNKNHFHKKDTFYTKTRLKYSNGTYDNIHKNFK